MFRKKNKQEQKKNSNETKKKKESLEVSYFMEKSPYYISPSFVSHNGRHASIVELYVRIGTNRQMTFVDVLDFIPISALEGVEMHFLTYDQLIKDDPKTMLIKNNANSVMTMNQENAKDQKKNDDDDMSKEEMRQAETQDYLDYQRMMEQPEPVVVFKIQLMIIADSRQQIDDQLEVLNLGLNTRHAGATWDSIGGDQQQRYTKLFDRLEMNQRAMTSTGFNYAGLNFAVSQGVFDDYGVPIGQDALSLSSSTAIFDFDSYLQKQAIIAIPRASVMAKYYKDGSTLQVSASSIMMQSAANQMLMNGKRSHHIVLNDFDYTESNLYYRPIETNTLFKHYDVSNVTINPLQGFGDIMDVTNIYARLTQKIVNIFDLLVDLTLDKGEKAAVLKAIDAFYLDKGYWIVNADKFPRRTGIVNIEKPETFATMGKFLDQFTILMRELMTKGLEMQADRVNTLEATLKQALTANMNTLGRTTTIKPTDAPQVYYDFGRIESARIKQIQYVNILEYVISTVQPGETIFIHGMNNLYEETLRMTKDAIISAQNKGIRFVFGFDTVTSAKTKTGKEYENMADLFTMKGVMYNNLSKEVDWSMVGRCQPEDVEKYSKAAVMPLGTTVESLMQSTVNCQVLLHRSMTQTNNFVHLNVTI